MSPPRAFHRRRNLIIVAMALTAIAAAAIFRPFHGAQDFHVPSAREARSAQALFAAAFAGARPSRLQAQAAPLGLEPRALLDLPGELVLRETAEACRGQGVYRLRAAAPLPLAIIAPHRGADRHTGTLATLLFEEAPVAAAAWNSAPRRPSAECPGGGDPTRVETHYLTAFSLAFAVAHPQGRIVQLHGFERAKRQSRAAQLADIIVSEGSEQPGARLLDLADCLSRTLHPLRVAVYPNDTSELGALTNRQGQALRAAGFDGFVHLEMAAELRRRLTREPALRATLMRCLAQGLE